MHYTATSAEIEVARRVQSAFLPSRCDACRGAHIAARHLMSRGIGGDYHDFLPRKDGRYTLVIGDVIGHELFSALVMSLIFGAVHTVGPEADSPLEVVRLVNSLLDRLNAQLRSHVLMSSLFVGAVEPDRKRLIYANAGHPPPLAQYHDGHIEDLAATCPILGVAPQLPLATQCLDLRRVHQILLYTDGLTEARDAKGRFLERDGAMDSLQAVQGLPVEQAVSEIVDRTIVFTGGQIADDITTVIVRFNLNKS
jgi:serine phosphatase RsbU (regulator of sigma subunit)